MPVIHLTSANHKITLRHQVNRINLRHSVNRVVLTQVGRRGLAGEGDKNYIQAFTNVSEITVTHSLSKYPAVTVTDSSGDEVVGDVEHVSVNQLVVRFSSTFSGQVICN